MGGFCGGSSVAQEVSRKPMVRTIVNVADDVKARLGITEQVLPVAVKAANDMMGIETQGAIPAQIARLAAALSIPGADDSSSQVVAGSANQLRQPLLPQEEISQEPPPLQQGAGMPRVHDPEVQRAIVESWNGAPVDLLDPLADDECAGNALKQFTDSWKAFMCDPGPMHPAKLVGEVVHCAYRTLAGACAKLEADAEASDENVPCLVMLFLYVWVLFICSLPVIAILFYALLFLVAWFTVGVAAYSILVPCYLLKKVWDAFLYILTCKCMMSEREKEAFRRERRRRMEAEEQERRRAEGAERTAETQEELAEHERRARRQAEASAQRRQQEAEQERFARSEAETHAQEAEAFAWRRRNEAEQERRAREEAEATARRRGDEAEQERRAREEAEASARRRGDEAEQERRAREEAEASARRRGDQVEQERRGRQEAEASARRRGDQVEQERHAREEAEAAARSATAAKAKAEKEAREAKKAGAANSLDLESLKREVEEEVGEIYKGSQQDVKARLHKLRLKWHPDKQHGDQMKALASELTKMINKAIDKSQ